MNASQTQPGRPVIPRPRIHIKLRSGQGKTEVWVQANWRLTTALATRLAVVILLILAAIVGAATAHGELARGLLYSAAGILTGMRPRHRT
jgi:hypothetical protein